MSAVEMIHPAAATRPLLLLFTVVFDIFIIHAFDMMPEPRPRDVTTHDAVFHGAAGGATRDVAGYLRYYASATQHHEHKQSVCCAARSHSDATCLSMPSRSRFDELVCFSRHYAAPRLCHIICCRRVRRHASLLSAVFSFLFSSPFA